jgi:hypothetical protein
MNLIDDFILFCLGDNKLKDQFGDTLYVLDSFKKDAISKGHDLDTNQNQLWFMFSYFRKIEKRCVYTTKANSRALIVSLLSDKGSLTIFYNHYYKKYNIIHDRICVDEGFMGHPLGQDVNILQSVDSKRQFLYNDKGEFLEIDGDEIICTRDSFRMEYYRNFAIVKDNGTFDIYFDNLEPLILEADTYQIVGDWFCISQKANLQYLSHVSKGNILPTGFNEAKYFKDQYQIHNDIHYFILKQADGFAIFHLKKYLLWNNFDWEDYKAIDGFDYLYFKRNGEWFKLDLYKLKATATETLTFESRIKN